MRTILFRGKTKEGKWYKGLPTRRSPLDTEVNRIQLLDDYLENDSMVFFMVREVLPETVGQYTGLTDKNGKRIFEGDICRFREWSKGDMCWIGKVHYEHQQFVISGDKNKECESPFTLVMSRFISENIEVIGNIYDNPELLKGGA